MKKVTILVITYFLFSIPSLAICQEFTGNINAFWGFKGLNEDDWYPLDEQDELGISMDFKQTNWPVSIAIGYLSSSDEQRVSATDFKAETTEVSFGVVKIWDKFRYIRPYSGLGLAIIKAKLEGSTWGTTVSEEDQATGFWIEGGLYLTVWNHFNIGFDVRWSTAEVTLYDVNAEAGGMHAGLLVGFHF